MFPSLHSSAWLRAILTFLLLIPTALGLAVDVDKRASMFPVRRQVAAAAEVLGTIVEVAGGVKDLIKEVDNAQHDAESDFTQATVAQLSRLYPNKNVIIYHDQASTTNFVNGHHSHQELNLPDGPETQGYEIWVFDSGTFTLAGDGGVINWFFTGNFVRNGYEVTFYNIGSSKKLLARQTTVAAPATPILPPTSPTRANPGDTDGNYFVNCKNRVTGELSSGMAYYGNLVPGKNVGQQPNDYIDLVNGADVLWETRASVTFTTGVSVSWAISGTAQDSDVPVNSVVGIADNNYEHFWVYKDAGEWLYSTGDWDCDSIYWAF